MILRRRHFRSSEGKREGAVHIGGSRRSSADPLKEKICVSRLPTRFSRVIHRFSTAEAGEVWQDSAGARNVECG
jgi:hypothetical protein